MVTGAAAAATLLLAAGCPGPPDLRPTRSAISFLKCSEPANVEPREPTAFGLVCGAGPLDRYHLGDKLAEWCGALPAPLQHSYDSLATSCRVSIPISALHPAGGVFCQSKSPAGGRVVIEIQDVTRPTADTDTVGVEGAVYVYAWRVEGAETCRQHAGGHEVGEGLLRALDQPGVRRDRARAWLQALHDTAWDRLAGHASTAGADCVPHPDDD
jgi:hypothetical protein